jgi:hypothetical protein
MTLSCLFITDLQGKSIISRNYRGDVGVTQSIDTFQRYLSEVDDEAKTPVFHVDVHGDVAPDPGSVGSAGEVAFRPASDWVGGADWLSSEARERVGHCSVPHPIHWRIRR